MPCTYTGSLEGDRALAAEEEADKLADIITTLTQMLCSVCRAVEEIGREDIFDPLVEGWWQDHQLVDEKAAALEKLTEREKEILGLNN
jgi:hypothetical protein